ncbi:hypothetical protein ACJJTC_004566 [Scirpophaga incertulas]
MDARCARSVTPAVCCFLHRVERAMDARCARSVTPLLAASCTAWSAPWTRAAPARHGRALRQVSDPAVCCFLHRVERAMDARCARSVTPLLAASCTAWSAPWTRAAPGQ